ncbi:MAG TPA: lipid A biosynthesis acyltransferase, partial [Acinetobacter johnsonii]|nr:lipid A biosynthesis acyltransferase [Acinetobacter johnsonii]
MAIYYLLKIISLFPLSFLQYIARGIAHLLYLSDSSIKRITRINLQLAYPELDPITLQKRVHLSIQSQCQTYIEFLKCWGMPPQYNLDLLKNIHGESVLTEA